MSSFNIQAFDTSFASSPSGIKRANIISSLLRNILALAGDNNGISAVIAADITDGVTHTRMCLDIWLSTELALHRMIIIIARARIIQYPYSVFAGMTGRVSMARSIRERAEGD
ncbi:MAG: hypothetical protein SO002_01410, partial [Candidatus Faecousia sp.]|nr:hypothetical protein [Candidatus Faecousia sp.]